MKEDDVLTLGSLQVSDLFFNYERPALTEAYRLAHAEKRDITDDAKSAALKTDAESFAAMVGKEGDAAFVEWLASDYLRRE